MEIQMVPSPPPVPWLSLKHEVVCMGMPRHLPELSPWNSPEPQHKRAPSLLKGRPAAGCPCVESWARDELQIEMSHTAHWRPGRALVVDRTWRGEGSEIPELEWSEKKDPWSHDLTDLEPGCLFSHRPSSGSRCRLCRPWFGLIDCRRKRACSDTARTR